MVDETYKQYLQSDKWKAKRKIALERAFNRCQLCDSSWRLEVHHRTYVRFQNELPEDLTVLCKPCHELVERNKQEKQTSRSHATIKRREWWERERQEKKKRREEKYRSRQKRVEQRIAQLEKREIFLRNKLKGCNDRERLSLMIELRNCEVTSRRYGKTFFTHLDKTKTT